MQINSKEYWDKRFATDWISKFGKEQSAFFGQIALNALPFWLVSEIKKNKLSICDWGCALGDGTQQIKKLFADNNVTGIDFSITAIREAKEVYKEINFLCEDILSNHLNFKYDIVFSSNTLEHFANPWTILNKLTEFSNQHIVVLIPYKEVELYGEHVYQFTNTNIVSKIDNSFSLTHFEIIDAGKLSPSFWGGLQLLLIYSEETIISRLNLVEVGHIELSLSEGLKNLSGVISKISEVKVEITEEIRKQAISKESLINEYKGVMANKDVLIDHYNTLFEIRSLISANKILSEELIIHKSTITSLQNELELKNKVDTISNDYLAILAELKQLYNTIEEDWKQKLHTVTKNLAEKERKIALLEGSLLEKEVLQKKIKELEIENNNYKTKINQLLFDLDQSNTDLANQRSAHYDEMNTLKQELRNRIELENLTRRQDLEITILRKENDKLSAQSGIIKLLEIEIDEKRQLTDQYFTDLQTEQQKNSDLANEIEGVRSYVNKLTSDIEWYKKTFETRTIPGILKEKFFQRKTK